jgi:hypothetical protein
LLGLLPALAIEVPPFLVCVVLDVDSLVPAFWAGSDDFLMFSFPSFLS